MVSAASSAPAASVGGVHASSRAANQQCTAQEQQHKLAKSASPARAYAPAATAAAGSAKVAEPRHETPMSHALQSPPSAHRLAAITAALAVPRPAAAVTTVEADATAKVAGAGAAATPAASAVAAAPGLRSCSSCAMRVSESARYCAHCGHKL